MKLLICTPAKMLNEVDGPAGLGTARHRNIEYAWIIDCTNFHPMARVEDDGPFPLSVFPDASLFSPTFFFQQADKFL